MKKIIAHILLLLLLLPGVATAQLSDEETPSDKQLSTVQSEGLTNQIELYPNPVVTYLFVEIYNPDIKRPVFELHNIIGNTFEIEAEEVAPYKYRIHMETFRDGYYFLVVQDQATNFNQAHKFLKR